MSGHLLIPANELLEALRNATPCQDCAGGLGVHVDLADPQAWEVVQAHNVPCVAMADKAKT